MLFPFVNRISSNFILLRFEGSNEDLRDRI